MIESGIEKSIKQFIKLKGGWITRIQSGAVKKEYTTVGGMNKTHFLRLAEAGTPDMIGCLNGTFLGVEVKKDKKEVLKWMAYPNGLKGKPIKFNSRNDAQKNASREIRKAGGFFAVVCSVDELEKDLKAIGILS